MSQIHQQIQRDLEKFHTEKSLDALRGATNRAESIAPDAAKAVEERRGLRRTRFGEMLTVLAAIDEEIDPSFDPSDVPSLSVTPPVVRGAVLDSGIDPKHIKDPEVRHEYEQAIARNAEKSARYKFQSGLRRIDDELMGFVTRSIGEPYAATEAGRQEIQEALQKYLKNESRKARLRELLDNKR
jgi:hypothetical protein